MPEANQLPAMRDANKPPGAAQSIQENTQTNGQPAAEPVTQETATPAAQPVAQQEAAFPPARTMPSAAPNAAPTGAISDAPPSVSPDPQPLEAQPNESLVAILDQMADPDGDSRWDRSTKRTVLVIMLVALVFIFYISRPVIPMILIAAIMAYLFSPIVGYAERLRIPRAASTIALYLLVIGALVLAPLIFIPTLIDQLRALSAFDVPGTARGVIGWANSTLQGLPETITIIGYQVPVGSVARQFQNNGAQPQYAPSVNDILNAIQQTLSATTNVVSSTATIGINVVGTVFSTFLAILVTFFVSLYMTMDAPRIQSYFHGLFPTSYRSELADLLRRIGLVWQSFLRGQLILGLVVGTFTWMALSIVGMPGALIFGILAGLLEVVPNLGPILAMIPAVITALIQGSDVLGPMGIDNIGFALITVGIYFLIQQLENNILVPRIIGDSINLHPIVVICAVAVGLSTGGILGALLAPPIVATFRVIGSYIHAKLLDYPPFAGRPLPTKRPREHRRTVSGKELSEP
jgi:predicted PurR-regulated permease PerM